MSTISLTEMKTRTAAATVRLTQAGGLGVLVPGGFVLTAAHCVDSYNSGGMTLGDHCLEVIKPRRGTCFRLSVASVEPVSDIAALGEPDSQHFEDDAEAFEKFCERTDPVVVSETDLELRVPVAVHILTHTGKWIEGTATRYGFREVGRVALKAQRKIESGTSGGPIINSSGKVVGWFPTARSPRTPTADTAP